MSLIAQHPYIKTERIVTRLGQHLVEHDRYIYLYSDKVVTAHREFSIKEVIDFSYRTLSKEGGILYLHTTQGVYTYVVNTSPEMFIKSFKSYFK